MNAAPRDGTVIGMIGRNLPFQALMGDTAIRFDLRDAHWIGNPEVTNRVCAHRPDQKINTAKDLLLHEILIGGAGEGGALSTIPLLLSRMMGMKLKLIEGYLGPREVLLAIERGELDGVCMSLTAIESLRPGWIDSGKLKVLFNMEEQRVAGSNIPSIFEFTKTDDDRSILSLFNVGVLFGRPIVAPPDVPADRVDILRLAFETAMADPDLLYNAKKIGLEVGMVKGDQLDKLIHQVMATPKGLVSRFKNYTIQ
jgi:tripartite-type tricarboxylate transporter receptor subunit TctC